MCKNKRCRCCCRQVKTICITASASAITLTVPPCSFAKPGRYCLDVCTPIPALTPGTDPAIEVTDGTNIYPCYTYTGDYARADNITDNRHWSVFYGNDPEHITILRGIAPHTASLCDGDGYAPVP